MLFVGIDGEMSKPNLDEGGRLIQIGVSVRLPDGTLDSEGWVINPGEMAWDDQAAAVHGIPYEIVIQQGRSQDSVDSELHQWLIDRGAHPSQRAKNVPVGFNITGFDLPFIKRQLPKTFALLSRRTAELNGMLWLLDGVAGKNFEAWKQEAMRQAHHQMEDYVPHDAEWDAKRHLLVLEYLRSVILVK
jgi:hypothetical protein